MNDIPDDVARPKPSLWVSIVIVVAGGLIVTFLITTIHYRDLYVDTFDRWRKAEFRRQTLEEDASNFRFRMSDTAAYVLQLTPTLTVAEIESFRQKGLWDPYADIANDLINHPELISADSIPENERPGLAREGICVLGPNRVLALFAHGESQGRALLSYSVSDDGKISWGVEEAVVVE